MNRKELSTVKLAEVRMIEPVVWSVALKARGGWSKCTGKTQVERGSWWITSAVEDIGCDVRGKRSQLKSCRYLRPEG